MQQAADKAEMDYPQFCDSVSDRFRKTFGLANIGFTDFIRTSEKRHYDAVQMFWKRLYENGFIYLGEYEGWYCQSDESFLTDMQVEDVLKEITDADGQKRVKSVKVSKESGHQVEKIKEANYKFRLSAFEKPLLEWLESSPKVIVPESRFNEVNEAWLMWAEFL